MNDNVTHCPHCGQPIVPKVDWVRLKGQARAVYEACLQRPRSREGLRFILWGADPNGGPGERALDTVVCNLNRRLAPYGVRLQCIDGVYRFVELEAANGDRTGDAGSRGSGPGVGVRTG